MLVRVHAVGCIERVGGGSRENHVALIGRAARATKGTVRCSHFTVWYVHAVRAARYRSTRWNHVRRERLALSAKKLCRRNLIVSIYWQHRDLSAAC